MSLWAASPPVRKKWSVNSLRIQNGCYPSSARFSGCVQVGIPAGLFLMSAASGELQESCCCRSVCHRGTQHCQLQRISSSSVQNQGNSDSTSATMISLKLVRKLWSFSSQDCLWLGSFLCAPVVPPCWWLVWSQLGFIGDATEWFSELCWASFLPQLPFLLLPLTFFIYRPALAWITHASNSWANSGIIKENWIYLNRGVRF